MGLKFFEIQKAKRNSSEKRIQKEQQSKKIEYRIEIELMDKLQEYLENNDRLLIEVSPNFVGEFLNILGDKVVSLYEFEQVDKNKFIFYNKEMEW